MSGGPAFCPNATVWRSSCKRRTCAFCGPRWARDWRQVMEANLEAYGGPVILVSITAPGADRLPWDETHCGHRRPHKHSGVKGCRVQRRAAREWTDTLSLRWSWLRRAADMHTRRHSGQPATLLERVWEPQKRGVLHLHLVLGYATEVERQAARTFVHKLYELAPGYDFGFVDRRALKRPLAGKEAARYLASYLTGRSAHKPTMRETLEDPSITYYTYASKPYYRTYRLPLVWLTPRLTKVTFVTMRTLRRARHLWAAVKGMCPPPKWTGLVEGLKVGSVYRSMYLKRGPPIVGALELDLARQVDGQLNWSEREEWGMMAVRFALGRVADEPGLELAAA